MSLADRLRARSPLRVRVPGLGHTVIVADERQIPAGEACDDVARLGAIARADLPAWMRRFFAATLFTDARSGRWFIPFEAEGAELDARRRRLANGLARGFVDDDVARLVAALRGGAGDAALAAIADEIINRRFRERPPPPEIIADSRKTLRSPAHALNPVRHRRARRASARVIDHCGGDIDLAHNVNAATTSFVGVLRRVAADPSRPVADILADRAPTAITPRVTVRPTTLAGLLRRPVPRGSGVLLLNGLAARRTRDLRFVFGHGTDRRRCLFHDFAVELLSAVREGLLAGE